MAKELVDDQKSHIPNKDDVVAELIWGLPYHRFYGYFGSGSVDDLEKIGLPAIPQLEEALNDNRPIRSLMHPTTGPRMSQDLHTIYRVKSAAMEAIERIAHQWFDGRTPEETRANIDHWYHVAQTQGEEAALVANVRKGGQNSLEGASVLVEKYPDAAFAAIVAAYNESDESVRAELYKTLTRLHTKPDGLLRDIAKNGRETRLRVAALSILAEQAPQEALPLAIANWQSLEDDAPSMETSDLISILLRSQRPEALRALQSGLRKRPQSVRNEVVFRYDRDSIFHKFRGGVDAIPITDETRPVIEDLLASELDDDDAWMGTLTFDRVNLTLPKISTLVLFELSRLYPGVYSFKDTTSDADLDRQKKEAMKTHQLRVKARGGTNP
ncbi:MAG: hypothetical protein JST51_20165 [Armatimonadetes bacterium]|nr:hypothetical protein [Armatimonadota bacterium]